MGSARSFNFLLTAVLALLPLFVGCEAGKSPSSTPKSGTAMPEPPRVLGTVPKFVLNNEDGKEFSGGVIVGRAWIATFIFTRCGATCPAQTAEFARLQNEIQTNPALVDTRLVSISVDPEHDTPEVLKEYAKKAGANPQLWTFLTGDREAIWKLCKDGFKLPVADSKDTPGMPISHSQSFVLIDRVGRIRGYYDGLNDKARQKLRTDLGQVLNDPKWPVCERKKRIHDTTPGQVVYHPPAIKDRSWLQKAARAQLETRASFDVYHDFKFTDRLPQSGITFVNRVVDDAGKKLKAVHYDHGTGVAIADVDGDGLLDIYFVTQLGENQLARNVDGGKFEDITKSAGVGLGDRVGVSASFADIDNDSDPDLFVTTVRTGNVLFENLGNGKFRDISAASGLNYSGHSSGAVFFDYDRDGLVDLFVCNVGVYTTDKQGAGGYYVGVEEAFLGHLKPEERAERSLLYRNLGEKRFEEVSEKLGLNDMSWTGDASPLDFNEDGWPDLYVLSMQGHDEYYENVGGKSFVKKSREIFPATAWGSMGIKVFDAENDGDMDIYTTDMHTDMIDDLMFLDRQWWAEKLKMHEMYPDHMLATDGNHILGNAFYRNEGNGTFREVSDMNGTETYWPWGLSTGDLNADGWEDIFVTGSMNFPFRYSVNSVLLNNRGERFLDSEFILGAEPRRDGRTTTLWFEVDCDDPEVHNTASAGICKDRKGVVEVYASIGSRSSVIFDLDNDGDLDIVINDFHSEPVVLISDLSDKKTIHYLKVRLAGVKSNRSGFGARVRVRAGNRTYTKVQDGVSGYLSHSDAPLYFGLGDASQADSIEVTWPSGTTQTVAGPIKANELITVTEQ
jgi:cytochrome oxidase Cu insertion factor (SCO1/SenC/PrrC family)